MWLRDDTCKESDFKHEGVLNFSELSILTTMQTVSSTGNCTFITSKGRMACTKGKPCIPSGHKRKTLLDWVDDWIGNHQGKMLCRSEVRRVKMSSITPPKSTIVVCGLRDCWFLPIFEGSMHTHVSSLIKIYSCQHVVWLRGSQVQ